MCFTSVPLLCEGCVAEAVSKRVDRSAGVKLVASAWLAAHAHVEHGDLVDVVCWVLQHKHTAAKAISIQKRCMDIAIDCDKH